MVCVLKSLALFGHILQAAGRTVYNVVALAEPLGKPVDLAYLRSRGIAMFETGRVVRRTPRNAAETVAALLRMRQYDFAVGGAGYKLLPLDRLVAAGGRCLGRFAGLSLRGDAIVLRYAGGDLGAGGARYSAVVEIGAAETQTARKALLGDTGSFHFSLRIPELLEDTEEVSLGIVVPSTSAPSEKGGDGRIMTSRHAGLESPLNTEILGSQILRPLNLAASKPKKREQSRRLRTSAPKKIKLLETGKKRKHSLKPGNTADADTEDEGQGEKEKESVSSGNYGLADASGENLESNGNNEEVPL